MMNIYPKTAKLLPNKLVWKMMSCFVVLYVPTVVGLKYLFPLIYGPSATPGLISQTIVSMVMPAMMIGMGLLSIRAETERLKTLMFRSIAVVILISGIALIAGLSLFNS